jgi:hypothetical protein
MDTEKQRQVALGLILITFSISIIILSVTSKEIIQNEHQSYRNIVRTMRLVQTSDAFHHATQQAFCGFQDQDFSIEEIQEMIMVIVERTLLAMPNATKLCSPRLYQ